MSASVLLISALLAGCNAASSVPGGGVDAGPPPAILPIGGSLPGGQPATDAGGVPPDPTCASNGDCDDFDPCTLDTCDPVSHKCNFTAADCPETCFLAADCDDNNPCTDDTCGADSLCTHAERQGCVAKECKRIVDCDDGDPCTQDGCLGGFCNYAPSPECAQPCAQDTDCDDQDLCTVDECVLADKTCANDPVDCDDGNPCTDDVCDQTTGGCNHPTFTIPCDDGDACTTGDQCQEGKCVGQSNGVSCEDGDPCTEDFCTGSDGSCGHRPLDCDDGNDCTADTCGPVGCEHSEQGGACEDGDPCTLGDVCAAGACRAGGLNGAALILSFDEGQGRVAADSSGVGPDGALQGNASWGVGREGGSSLFLPGDDAVATVRIGGDSLQSSRFTIAMWVNPALAPLPGNDRILFSRATQGRPNGLLLGIDGFLWIDEARVDGGPKLALGTWAHVALTYDGVTVRVYKDGSLVRSSAVNRTPVWGGDLWLGQEQDQVDGGFQGEQAFGGRLDDVTWFNRALSADEVRTLAAGGAPQCADGNACTRDLCVSNQGGCTFTQVPGCN